MMDRYGYHGERTANHGAGNEWTGEVIRVTEELEMWDIPNIMEERNIPFASLTIYSAGTEVNQKTTQ
jgi:hypothetical protein